MTPEQKAALEWLDKVILWGGPDSDVASTLKAMLAEPRLPEELDGAAIHAMGCAATTVTIGAIRAMSRALYAHLTKPKTKTVEMWHVRYSFREFEALDWKPQISAYPDTPEGRRARDNWIASFKDDSRVNCIHITGPHKQEVPA